MINTLIGLGIGAVVAVAATIGGVAAYQGSPHGISQTKLYSYSDN
jgi:hypothetical protein